MNEAKIDEVVLALLYLTTHEQYGQLRAWKGHDWAVLDRLHDEGMIHDPKSKAKSVALTGGGARRSRELFVQHFDDDES